LAEVETEANVHNERCLSSALSLTHPKQIVTVTGRGRKLRSKGGEDKIEKVKI